MGHNFGKKFECRPKVVSQIGRPPKKRKKSQGEIEMLKGGKLTRKSKVVKCTIWKMTGQNKRGCPTKARRTSATAGTSSSTMPSQAVPSQPMQIQVVPSHSMPSQSAKGKAAITSISIEAEQGKAAT